MDNKTMNRLRHGVSLAIFAYLLWALVLKPYPTPADGPDFWAAAKNGHKVSVGIEDDHLLARFWVASDPAKLESAILDVKSYEKNFPGVFRVTELSRSDSGVAAGGRISVLGPFSVSFSFGAKAEPKTDDTLHVSWKGTGTGLRLNEGSWELKPYDNGTAVSYRITLQPAALFIPATVANRLVIPVLAKNLRGFSNAKL